MTSMWSIAALASLAAVKGATVSSTGGGVPLSQPLLASPQQCGGMGVAAAPAPGAYLSAAGLPTLAANSQTVHWGYFSAAVAPNLVVQNGSEFMVEMISHHAGDDPRMRIGDPGIEDIFSWTTDGQNIGWRGRSGKGDGVHLLTGPVYVCGAEPGDVLQVDILDLKPRKNPSLNKCYGSNAAASWGYHFNAGFLDGIKKEVITIYELQEAPDGSNYVALPDVQFQYGQYIGTGSDGALNGYTGPVTNCTTTTGPLPGEGNGLDYTFNNSARAYRKGNVAPCINGTQSWPAYLLPGILTTHPTGTEDYSIRGKFKVPVNLHIGNMGLASNTNETQDSVPPFISGGNVDDRRIGAGASMYYPVQVEGALLSMGDAHTAMGDSELDGTGIETSITGQFRVTLHKQGSMAPALQNLNFPLLENADNYVVHGYTVTDPVGLADPSSIYSMSSLDKAMTNCYNQTRDFMMRSFNLTENQAITAITVLVDFGVDQVVDGNYGIHAIVPKWPFLSNMTDLNSPYVPTVITGSSLQMSPLPPGASPTIMTTSPSPSPSVAIAGK